MNIPDNALTALQAGEVIVMPTDTVYGVVASAKNMAAVTELYALKHREQKPGTLLAASVEQLVELGVPARYLKPVAHYWPNPLSVVVPLGAALPYLHQGKMSLAMRIPRDEGLRAFLLKSGPLLTSSANQPGEPPATTIAEARGYFNDAIKTYIDGGDLSGSLPSTIIRVVDDAIEVLRPGAVAIDDSGVITP